MVDLSSAIFCGATAVIFCGATAVIFCGAMAVIFCGATAESSSAISCGATAESSSAIFCGGMGCGAMTESTSASNDSLMVESSSAIFCNPSVFCGGMADSSSAISCSALADSSSAISCSALADSSSAISCSALADSSSAISCSALADSSSAISCSALADSSLPTNDSPSSLAIFCSAVGVSSSPTGDSPMAEIKDIAVAESSSPINDEVWRLFSGEKTARKVSGGAANVLLWRMKKIGAAVCGGATTIWVLFMRLGYHMRSLIFHCLVTVLYLGPAVTNFINKAFVILTEINRGFAEINRGFAEINRCFTEIKRGFAEIKKGVAVLRRIMGRRMWKFLIAFFLVCICILYASSLPHIREVNTPPQVSISKDLIVNITVYMRDNEGFVVRREFMFHIAIVFR